MPGEDRVLPGSVPVRPLLRVLEGSRRGEALSGRTRLQGRRSEPGTLRHSVQRRLRRQDRAPASEAVARMSARERLLQASGSSGLRQILQLRRRSVPRTALSARADLR
ncbi:UNVERIFIED_CONTAM: hypothetical protein PYX00_003855 [Menopon gallinae]|uniref:Uncharacterized protein n=1 Tax=Menopon gallinae TaxID=328185 RepID=A0AAW2I328_9NEOP